MKNISEQTQIEKYPTKYLTSIFQEYQGHERQGKTTDLQQIRRA